MSSQTLKRNFPSSLCSSGSLREFDKTLKKQRSTLINGCTRTSPTSVMCLENVWTCFFPHSEWMLMFRQDSSAISKRLGLWNIVLLTACFKANPAPCCFFVCQTSTQVACCQSALTFYMYADLKSVLGDAVHLRKKKEKPMLAAGSSKLWQFGEGSSRQMPGFS